MALIKCPECGKEISNKATACPNCGYPIDNLVEHTSPIFTNETVDPDTTNTSLNNPASNSLPPQEPSKTSTPFYSKTWFILLSMCCCCFPVGLFLMWKYKKFNKPIRIAITTFFAIMFLASMVKTAETPTENAGSAVVQNDYSSQSAKKATETTTKETLSPKDDFIDKLTQNENVLTEAAEKAYTIITEQLGFEDVSVDEADENLTLFNINADSYTLKLVVSDDVYRILCGSYTLYENDEVNYIKQDLDDRSLQGNETHYYSIAKEIVSSNLKAPKTAEYPSIVFKSEDIKIARNKDLIAVQSYVDAQNSFGALVRSEYLVEFRIIDLKSYTYETVYINIDGEEFGSFIDLK